MAKKDKGKNAFRALMREKDKEPKETRAPRSGTTKFVGDSQRSWWKPRRAKGVRPVAAKGNLGADAWGQMSELDTSQKSAYRDVHTNQQLRRGEMGDVRGYAMPRTAGITVGVLVFILLWLLWGFFGWVASFIGIGGDDDAELAEELGVAPYVQEDEMPIGTTSRTQRCFQGLDPAGNPVGECQKNAKDVEEPQWHKDQLHQAKVDAGLIDPDDDDSKTGIGGWLLFSEISLLRTTICFAIALAAGGTVYTVYRKQIDARNAFYDVEDINQHTDDQHLALVQEVVERYSHFPDVGAHSPEQPSSMISHIMLDNKGINKVQQTQFAESDVIDEEGNLVYIKGEPMYNEDGTLKSKEVPFFDKDFAHELYSASSLPEDKKLRKFFDANEIAYNPGGKVREKVGKQVTLAQHINEMWTYPEYEVQRPAGSYVVDVAPVNTMILAITRAGKGQTYIEPMIDMWLREMRPNNLVVNDPKGELLVKFAVRAAIRGFELVQFNLINPLKTDIYNPLGLAAEAARAGDSKRAAMIVTNIAEVFFPVDGADDPVWPSAANNAFKRTAYGIIDFYLEEENEMRQRADRENWEPARLKNELDAMWGKVTLFNCYQLFVQLSAKKLKDPLSEVDEKAQAGEYGPAEELNDENSEAHQKYQAARDEAEEKKFLWDGQKELDMLTLFFNATDALPNNSMRELVSNADKSLRSMGAAEKMLASVYGIAITAMSFFTDPTISTLTSGTPAQNFDMSSTSFPRRFGVRLDENFVHKNKLLGAQVKWVGYSDAQFSNPLGKEFVHEDTIGRDNWARCFFEGKFDNDVSYLKLEIYSNGSGLLLNEMYFKFIKGYQTDLRGQSYVKDPITKKKIAKDGLLVELVPETYTDKEGNQQVRYVEGDSTFKRTGLNLSSLSNKQLVSNDVARHVKTGPVDAKVIITNQAAYSDRTKAIFLVTPPHLTKYAKLLLILIKQLVDQNFDSSYMTKPSQKPLYKTRYMLDELGNLQSEGQGISGFETMLSIGLGQEQQFTLILQTIQQLRDVYGESVDKIVQGNAQPYESRIATPSGWTTMGEIEVGDEVVTPYGTVAPVDGVYERGEREVFDVMTADGGSAQACGEHLWEVYIEG